MARGPPCRASHPGRHRSADRPRPASGRTRRQNDGSGRDAAAARRGVSSSSPNRMSSSIPVASALCRCQWITADRSPVSRNTRSIAADSTRTMSYGGMPRSHNRDSASSEPASTVCVMRGRAICWHSGQIVCRCPTWLSVFMIGRLVPHGMQSMDTTRSRSSTRRLRRQRQAAQPARLGQQLRGRGAARWSGQLQRRGIRLVTHAVVAALEPGPVELIADAVVDQRFAGGDRQAVEQFQRLLGLQPADHGRDRRRRRHLAGLQIFLPQQRTAVAQVDQAVVVFRHRAFVAGAVGRHKHLHDAVDFLNAAVDPRRAHFPATAVHPPARFAIVQTADHHVDIAKQPQADVGDHVGAEAG